MMPFKLNSAPLDHRFLNSQGVPVSPSLERVRPYTPQVEKPKAEDPV